MKAFAELTKSEKEKLLTLDEFEFSITNEEHKYLYDEKDPQNGTINLSSQNLISPVTGLLIQGLEKELHGKLFIFLLSAESNNFKINAEIIDTKTSIVRCKK